MELQLLEIIAKNYDLEPILKIDKTENGSGNTYLVDTVYRKYIVKANERIDFVNIYERVQQNLNERNIKQSRVIRTNFGSTITPERVAVYEFIEGSNYRSLNKCQLENAIKYMIKYNEALKTVPFNENEIVMANHWDKAKSMEFIVNGFPDYLPNLKIDAGNKENIYNGISILAENRTKLLELSKQLIHSDLGPDNFIFNGDEVISIIDFTPEYNHELYALCQFIYWSFLWGNQNKNFDKISTFLRLYNNNGNREIEVKNFYILLIEAVLFRIIGPAADMLVNNKTEYGILDKRLDILRYVITNLRGKHLLQ